MVNARLFCSRKCVAFKESSVGRKSADDADESRRVTWIHVKDLGHLSKNPELGRESRTKLAHGMSKIPVVATRYIE